MRHLREVPQEVLVALQLIEMVGLHMSMEVRLLVEPLVAVGELAREWLLSGVDPLMSLQVEV